MNCGGSLEEMLLKLGQFAEGVCNAPKLLSLVRALKVSLPITHEVCLLLDKKKDAREALNSLLKREPSDE